MNVEDNDENELIYDKLTKFKLFQPIFEKIELYNNDEEFLYLIICSIQFLYISIQKKKTGIMSYLNILFCVVCHLNLRRQKYF